MQNGDMASFLAGMPKAELHLHIEGAIPASLILALARRNGVEIPYASEQALIDAQDYPEPVLVNFLNYHYLCMDVVRTEQDIFDIACSYLTRCIDENIRHAEISFDPQPHLDRGIPFGHIVNGLNRAQRQFAETDDLSSVLIMCINRDRSQAQALQILELAEPFVDRIAGVGLDSYEHGNPPIKFLQFYQRAGAMGFRLTAHCDCDQENSVAHIWQCLDQLAVERIDHGLHCLDDPELIRRVREHRITLTMCPTWRPSDPAPRRVAALRQMLDAGLPVTINTDDPEEFASRYLTHTLTHVQQAGQFTAEQMVQFMRNAFAGAWLPDSQIQQYLADLDAYQLAFDRGDV